MYSRIRISGERQAVFPVRQTPSGTVAFFCPGARRHPALDALAIVRMEGKKGVCETACWSGTPHLPEALMLRAFNGKEFPKAFDTPFSEEALAALFPEETARKAQLAGAAIACDADALGLLFVGRESGETEWPDRERDFLRLVCAMLGFFFAGKAHCEQQSFHIGVLNAAMDQVKVGLYVTDPHTDAILYMNKFMKDVFKLEHPEGKICWQVLQSGMNGAARSALWTGSWPTRIRIRSFGGRSGTR